MSFSLHLRVSEVRPIQQVSTGEMYSLVKSRSEFTLFMRLANNNKRCTDVGHPHSEDTSCIPIGEVANQAHNKKNLPPSTRKWKRTPSKPVEGEKE
jgi:tRNA U34 5-carboxymethylaminomethyl modifying enzyme MnmG/GidA